MRVDTLWLRGMSIQAVIFARDIWTTDSARRWLKSAHLVPIKRVHITTNYLRYRITDPRVFRKFRLSKKKDGIRFVYGLRSP